MSDLSFYVNKDNWPTDLEQAKKFGIEASSKWKWKNKSERFIEEIKNCSSVTRVQQLVIFPLLSGDGLKVIK